jgi:hypothetical protein
VEAECAECGEGRAVLAERGGGHWAEEDEVVQGRRGAEYVGERVDPACACGVARWVEGPFEAAQGGQGGRAGGELEAQWGGAAAAAIVVVVVWVGAHEDLEVREAGEEREGGRGVVCGRGGGGVGQDGAADAVVWHVGGGVVCDGGVARGGVQCGDAVPDADVLVEQVRSKEAPLLAH